MKRFSDRMILYPIIASLLALVLMLRDAKAERVWGKDEKGRAFVCERFERGPLIEFCFRLTEERG